MPDEHAAQAASYLACAEELRQKGHGPVSIDDYYTLAQIHATLHLADKVNDLVGEVSLRNA